MKSAYFSVLALMTAGCSGLGIGSEEYGCRGLPEGTQCHSAREVYRSQGNFFGGRESPGAGSIPAAAEAVPESGSVRPAEIFGRRLYRYPEDVAITVINGYTDRDGTAHSTSLLLNSLDNGYWYRGADPKIPDYVLNADIPDGSSGPEVAVPFREETGAGTARR